MSMTIAELIDELTKLPNKHRDVAVHVHGTLSGIVNIIGIDDKDADGNDSELMVFLDADPCLGKTYVRPALQMSDE